MTRGGAHGGYLSDLNWSLSIDAISGHEQGSASFLWSLVLHLKSKPWGWKVGEQGQAVQGKILSHKDVEKGARVRA